MTRLFCKVLLIPYIVCRSEASIPPWLYILVLIIIAFTVCFAILMERFSKKNR